jgi:hypothetical protein
MAMIGEEIGASSTDRRPHITILAVCVCVCVSESCQENLKPPHFPARFLFIHLFIFETQVRAQRLEI